MEPVVTLVEAGHSVQHRGRRRGNARTVTIDRVYEVTLDGAVFGYVGYAMRTREHRTPGRRYVNSRWQSPGWAYGPSKSWQSIGADSLKNGVERLVRDQENFLQR